VCGASASDGDGRRTSQPIISRVAASAAAAEQSAGTARRVSGGRPRGGKKIRGKKSLPTDARCGE